MTFDYKDYLNYKKELKEEKPKVEPVKEKNHADYLSDMMTEGRFVRSLKEDRRKFDIMKREWDKLDASLQTGWEIMEVDNDPNYKTVKKLQEEIQDRMRKILPLIKKAQ